MINELLGMVLSAGDITTFNIQHGYVEGLVRGYRSGYLDDVDYHHLTQCETLEGLYGVGGIAAVRLILAMNRCQAEFTGNGL